jgi:hypothetical protein
MRPRYRSSYKAPAIDGPKARQNAQIVLQNARHLDNITPESLAHSWGLKPATAAEMIAVERIRRAANG